MSIQTQIDRLASAKAAIKTAIEGKGVTVPADTLLSGMAALIETIEAGGGGMKYATGTFTPVKTTALNSPYKIEHNLGYVPDLFYWCTLYTSHRYMGIVARFSMVLEDDPSSAFGSYVAGYDAKNSYEGVINHNQPTANEIWIRSDTPSHKVEAGVIHKWIAIGGIE